MIELIPAIDLIGGKCVRLTKGDFTTKKVYSADPVETARKFEDEGFTRLHLVDLDGAGDGRLRHLKLLEKISGKTGLKTDFGGGVRDLADVRSIFNAGAAMVCIGSMAVANTEEFGLVLQQYGPDRVLLAADAANRKLVVSGWKEDAGIDLLEFIGSMEKAGVRQILCTDVEKDGMLQGPSLSLYKTIIDKSHGIYLIASGGVSSVSDIEDLEEAGIPAVVFGKAYYEGRITIDELRRFIG